MFYASVWDPWLIVSLMVLLQCALYLAAGGWLALFALTFGSSLRLAALLSPAQMSLGRAGGWAVLGAWSLAAPVLSYALLHAVGRAKQCLDFTLSAYGLHALVCWLYSGSLLSAPWEWWLVNCCGCVLTVLLGEWLCLRRELEAIPVTADERTQRERRAQQQAAINASNANGGNSGGSASAQELGRPAERTSLLSGGGGYDDSASSGLSGGSSGGGGLSTKGVTTSTIRLTPNNVFNV